MKNLETKLQPVDFEKHRGRFEDLILAYSSASIERAPEGEYCDSYTRAAWAYFCEGLGGAS